MPGFTCAGEGELERPLEQGVEMSRGERQQLEQVVNLLRQIETAVANGKTTARACKEAVIVERPYFHWQNIGLASALTFIAEALERHGGNGFVADHLVE